eukprot:TRINITY_DN344_c2_g1_i1.p1 TRINITY_DN344_c2_g1~~TRINITY_DN344_c2_g1_i1.p1  ORF type:complete len:725 (+),score=91.25 TRINITY_DN344_c2_g1_i1:55-2175(+)
MASHAPVPASPLLSPGRQLYRQVPPSPVVGFRGTGLPLNGVLAHGTLGATSVVTSPWLVARHTKSTSDLGQGRRSCYDPGRLAVSAQPGQNSSTLSGGIAMGGSAALPVHNYAAPTGTAPGLRACSPRSLEASRQVNAGARPPLTGRLSPPNNVTGGMLPANLARSPSPVKVETLLPPRAASAAAPAGPSQCSIGVVRADSYAPGSPVSLARQMAIMCHPKGDAQRRPWGVGGQGIATSGQQPSARQADASTPRAIVSRNASGHSGNAISHSGIAFSSRSPTLPVQGAGSLNIPCAGSSNKDGQDMQVAQVRDSLLQHIQSVQQEISRLQAERQKQMLEHNRSLQESRSSLSKQAAPSSSAPSMDRAKPAGSEPAEAKNSSMSKPLKPVHYAAARIQRAWRISNWRRKFIDHSVNQLGWLGSLAWLQQQNLLYGTELADEEDARWWMEQRQDAPLDHEVDPWGAMKLRDHLDRMWYGLTSEEMAQEMEQQKLLQQQQQQQQKLMLQQQGKHLNSSKDQLLSRSVQKTEGLGQGRYSLSMQDIYAIQSDGKLRGRLSSHGQGASLNAPVAALPVRTTLITSDACAARVTKGGAQRASSSALPQQAKSASLSPRRDMRPARAEHPSRAGLGVQSAGQGVPAVRSFLSPPSTHRALASSPVSSSHGSRQQSPATFHRSAQIPVMSAAAVPSQTAAMPTLRTQHRAVITR